MAQERILIIGACGQIGVELTLALRNLYGNDNVIATDIRGEHELLKGSGPYEVLNAMDEPSILDLVRKEKITQIYLLAPKIPLRNISAETAMHEIVLVSTIATAATSSPNQEMDARSAKATQTLRIRPTEVPRRTPN